MIAGDVLELIGNTPLIKINTPKGSAKVYAKCERNNPSGSVKDRAVLGMYEKAKQENKIKENTVFIEATSGNTGISLAMLGATKNHKVILTMPDSMSQERRDILQAYGAKLVLTEAAKGMAGADEEVKRLLEQTPNSIQLSQFENTGNPLKHFETTAIEILEDLNEIDVFLAGIGTGGTISGVSKYLKEKCTKEVKTIGIEPKESAVITTQKKGPHKIQGIGPGFVPSNFFEQYVDEVLTVSQDDAILETQNLVKSDGLLVGISSGANVYMAKQIAKNLGEDKIVVTVLPDDGMKYISTNIFSND